MNLATLLREHATQRGGQVALRTKEKSLTWSELDAHVDRSASALLGAGATKVAIVLPNTIEFVVALLGAMRAGVLAIPVNPGFTERELRHVITDSGADLVIDPDHPLSLDSVTPVNELPEVADDSVALLLYTSGTEGTPKGAMLTHGALIANHRQIAEIKPPIMSESDVVLLALPLFHAYGLNSGLGAVIWYGACGIVTTESDPVATAGLIALHRITVAVGVPPMYRAWGELPNGPELLRSLRLAVCGAAALDPADASRFTQRTGVAVHIGYGLTETAPVLTSTLASGSIKPGSIGKPLPGVSLKLVNAFGEMSDDDPGYGADDEGEIVVRGDNLFVGYWPDRRGGPGQDGWWRTGDVAYADADGDLFIVDRIGELIIVNGFNVYPAEVEQVLTAHPAVAEAAVLGVADPATGHAVHAYVVRSDSAVTDDELQAHCAANLARFKRPATIEFVDELPHSAIGKVRKKLLRDES
ncbi:MAG TPA: AMP-binding protein [Candidatus Limnocylindrales bacterium]|nr:AMP-binding protein [Candidatus Limnocylindrales bacterium]